MDKRIVGVYNTEQEAVNVINELKEKGYSSEDISVVAKDRGDLTDISDETGTKAPEGLATGAATGGILGGMTGLLAGIGALAIPGIGPIVAAGPIAATLTGAAVGAGTGGLVGGLVGMGIPEDEAEQYNEDVKSGKILVMVNDDKAVNNFNHETEFYDETTTHGATATLDRDIDTEEKTIPLREEKLNVSKDRVQSGEVRLHKEVVEENETINVPVRHEEVYVEERPVDETDAYDASNTSIGDDETIRIPVTEERVEIKKKPVVTGEVVVGKREVEETQHVQDTVKREEVRLDRDGNPIVEGGNEFRNRTENRDEGRF